MAGDYLDLMHSVLGTLPFAINYTDWLPLGQLFVVIKILLIPGAVIFAAVTRLRERRGGPKADESRADGDTPRPMWSNQTVDDVPVEPAGMYPPPPVPPPPGGFPPTPPMPPPGIYPPAPPAPEIPN
jgi:hypothetical protein